MKQKMMATFVVLAMMIIANSVFAQQITSVTYGWKHSTDGTNFTTITGETSETISAPTTTSGNNWLRQDVTGWAETSTGSMVIVATTSTIITYTVNDVVVFTQQPSDTRVNSGTLATFSVAVTGTTPISYQWYDMATTITGATSSTYSFIATGADNGTSISCIATNITGSTSSNPAHLIVDTKPVFSVGLSDLATTTGLTVNLSVTASNINNLTQTYVWTKNGIVVGGNSLNYSFIATDADNGAIIICTVTDSVGSVSTQMTLTVQGWTLQNTITDIQVDGVPQTMPINVTKGHSLMIRKVWVTVPKP